MRVKHAGSKTLERLEPLLKHEAAPDVLPGLKEKSAGVFYRGSKAFLHFHAGKNHNRIATADSIAQAEGGRIHEENDD
ncbi:MAG: hypothetical protein HY921_09580 [Elusimicrobia bacterium]|nr:hypothetical protein [Elusimicrobiota bacterium]